MTRRPSTPRGCSAPSRSTAERCAGGAMEQPPAQPVEAAGVAQDGRLGEIEQCAARSRRAGGVEDRVDGAAGRLVGSFHRRQIRVGAHVVGGQHQVGDPRRRLGPVAPRPGGVDQQRLEVGRLGRVGELDRRIEEPGEHSRLVEDRLRPVVEMIDELAPDLGADLLAAATRRHLAGAPSRGVPIGHVDGEDPANVPVAVAPDVDVAPELGLRDRRQRPLGVDVDRVTVDDRDVACRGRTARRSSTGSRDGRAPPTAARAGAAAARPASA